MASLTIHGSWFGIPEYDTEGVFTENAYLLNMGLWSLGFAVVALLIGIGLSCYADKRYKWFEDLVDNHLAKAFVFVWFFGFIIYNIGMYTGEPWTLLGNVPMAIVHAFGIFIFDGDVSAVHDPYYNNGLYMCLFALVHFLAALVSLMFVLKYFGFNIMAMIKRWRARSRKKAQTYVFWGMNDAAYYLAHDIKVHYGASKDYHTVVVRTNSDYDADSLNAQNGLDRVFSFLSIKKNDLSRFKELDCITVNTLTSLSTIDIAPEATLVDILSKVFHLGSLCRIISASTLKELHFFFLSDNEETNIQAVANLKKDSTLAAFLSKSKEHRIIFHCHARFNSVSRVIEDEVLAEGMEVKIVDSSHISVEMLKKKTELQPVNYVTVEKDATVSSTFNSLVVGFGEVGTEATRFLYEFGAFVKTGSTRQDVRRSDFNCHVIDKDMAGKAGLFVANAPSIQPALALRENDVPEDSLITLHQMDCQSTKFYQELETWLRDRLNYVVVCTDNDELNISLAVRIFKLAIRYRENLDQFCILVRIHKDENGHFQKIAWHYNRLWAANGKATAKPTHQTVVSSTEKVGMPIYLFGSDKEVYTFDNIVSVRLEDEAKAFKAKYDASMNAVKRLSGKAEDTIQTWEEERRDLMQLTGNYKGFSPTYSGVMRLRRTRSQNLSNCLHRQTKQILAESALGKDVCQNLRTAHLLFREDGQTKYKLREGGVPPSSVTRVLDVLAQTEHLRWNASHEILGYLLVGDVNHKDEARLQHGCLVPWQELPEDIQSYDYNVVDVSLDLIDERQ